MPTVELIYFPGCPNVAAARAQIQQAFASLAIEPSWREYDATAPDAPERVRAFGSPTILVDAVDVMGAAPAAGASCRVYTGEQGAPPLAAVVAALRASLLRAGRAQGKT